MKIKTDIILKSLDGQPLTDSDGKGNLIEVTLRMAMINAILAPVQNEKGTEKLEKYELAKRIHSINEIDLTSEEITLIKERITATYPSPLVVGQVYEILDPKDKKID